MADAERLSKPKKLRELMAGSGVFAPGAFDTLSARIIEDAGHNAVYMTGFGSSASILGAPDYGLLGMREMVDHARLITLAVNLPVIADADTGYGNPINVYRTVREYEAAGVAAIHIEDQVDPKRCGHMEGKEVIPTHEFANKIRAAVDAKTSSEFVIIARTDARGPLGMAEALRRGDAVLKAGADALFVEAPRNEDELRVIGTTFRGENLVANMIDGGKTTLLPFQQLREMGFNIVIHPLSLLFAASQAMTMVAKHLKQQGTTRNIQDILTPFDRFIKLVGLGRMKEMEREYGSSDY